MKKTATAEFTEMVKILRGQIKEKAFRNCYLLYGEEAYLVRQYREDLKNAVLSPDDTMNFTVFRGADARETDIIAQAETMPFFADHRLVLLEDTGLFTRTNERLPDFIANMPESTIFLFTELTTTDSKGKTKSPIDKRGRLYKAVAEQGLVLNCCKQTPQSIETWILSKVKKEKKEITRGAIELFQDKLGDDMNRIANELEKLFSYTANQTVIEKEDVEQIVSGVTMNQIFDMIDAISNQNEKRAIDLYADLMLLKEPPSRILYLIGMQYRRILEVQDLRVAGYDIATIAREMHLKEYPVRKYAAVADRYSRPQLVMSLRRLCDAEAQFKQGYLPEQLSVELLIVDLSKKMRKEEKHGRREYEGF